MAFVNDLDLPQFQASDVCRLTGMTPSRLKSWVSRRDAIIIMRDEDRVANLAGRPHLFSFRRLMQISITLSLVNLGQSLKAAANGALHFTDSGDEMRHPGFHYHEGEIFIFIFPATSRMYMTNVRETDNFHETLRLASSRARSSFSTTVAMINVAELEFHIRCLIPRFERDLFKMPPPSDEKEENDFWEELN